MELKNDMYFREWNQSKYYHFVKKLTGHRKLETKTRITGSCLHTLNEGEAKKLNNIKSYLENMREQIGICQTVPQDSWS